MRGTTTQPTIRGRGLALRSWGRALAASVVVGLVLFHALILLRRLRDLSILEPRVALQWVGSLLLLVVLAYLVQRRASLTRGRPALAFWLLVLLLHLLPAPPALDSGVDAELLLALPATWLGPTALALVALLLVSLAAQSTRAPHGSSGRRGATLGRLPTQTGLGSVLWSRPPPASLR